ncbi:MAG: rod shape-determining protein RodA [Candidatus Omnitrophica bacterium]|nr:rod shape-determining protein RodA [Candidatus Omnitrophota bacterium]
MRGKGEYYNRIVILAVLLAVLGIFSIYTGTIFRQSAWMKSIYLRQTLWVVMGLISLFVVSRISYRYLYDLTYFLYVLGIILLIIVDLSGKVCFGARRWLHMFWFNFQPAEMMKLIMIITVSHYFSASHSGLRSSVSYWTKTKAVVTPLLLVSLPVLLIFKQPDLGTAALIFLIFLFILFISRVEIKFIAFLSFLIFLLLPVLWFSLLDYQKARLLVFLNPNLDPLGRGYTIIQSKIAVASGGFWGRGWFSATQSQLQFLPESHTDFIFAHFAQMWGFFGSLVLLLSFYLLIRYGLMVARDSSDYFGYLLAGGITIYVALQVLINLAMIMGLVPIVGLPLPFLSYGGTSILVTFISLGILINIARSNR